MAQGKNHHDIIFGRLLFCHIPSMTSLTEEFASLGFIGVNLILVTTITPEFFTLTCFEGFGGNLFGHVNPLVNCLNKTYIA